MIFLFNCYQQPFTKVKFTHTDTLSETARGEGGYGHTGKNDVMNCKSDSTCTSKMEFVLPTNCLCDASLNKELIRELMDDYNKCCTFDDSLGEVKSNEYFIPVSDKNISIDFNNSDIPPFSSNLWIQCNENDVIILKCFHNTNETDFSIANFKFDIKQLYPNKIKYFIKLSGEKVWLYQDEKTGNEIIHESRIIFNPPKLI